MAIGTKLFDTMQSEQSVIGRRCFGQPACCDFAVRTEMDNERATGEVFASLQVAQGLAHVLLIAL